MCGSIAKSLGKPCTLTFHVQLPVACNSDVPGAPSLGSASETPHASVRSSGGILSIPTLTRCRVVVRQSSDPRADRLSRRRGRETVPASRERSRAARRALSPTTRGTSGRESMRSSGETLSISELTWCHAVVDQSSYPRTDHLSRRRLVFRSSERVLHEALERAVSATVGDRYTTTASAEVVYSWIRRLSHHYMAPCELRDAQSPARPPHRRVWSL